MRNLLEVSQIIKPEELEEEARYARRNEDFEIFALFERTKKITCGCLSLFPSSEFSPKTELSNSLTHVQQRQRCK